MDGAEFTPLEIPEVVLLGSLGAALGAPAEAPTLAAASKQEQAGTGEPHAGGPEPAKPSPSIRKPGKKKPKDNTWLAQFPQDLARLDVMGLLRALNLKAGDLKPYGNGQKISTQCILPKEHSDEADGMDAWVYLERGRLPQFHCSHSCHTDTLGLKDVLVLAGPEQVARFCPPMDAEELPYRPGGSYRCTSVGLLWVPDEGDTIHLCSDIRVQAQIRNEEGGEWGLLLSWNDHDGNLHSACVSTKLVSGDGTELRAILTDGGAYVTANPKGRAAFSDYINQVRVKARARTVNRTGWAGSTFVLPDGGIGGPGGEPVIYRPLRSNNDAYHSAGTLDDWRNNVGVHCIGNSRLITCVAAAVAAPMLRGQGMDSGGINFHDLSSTGKSTTLYVAGSVAGGGTPKGFVRSWRSTSSGLEGTCLAHNDAVLILDEMGEVDPNELGQMSYMIANGQGKSRANPDGTSRHVNTWTVMLLSSGEVTLADKMHEAGKIAKAGQEVRIVDIPADAGRGMGIFENVHGAEDGAKFADMLKKNALAFYGTPLREYLRAVASSEDQYRSFLVNQSAKWMTIHCPITAGGQVKRVAGRFALIAAAGELAASLGVFPWPEGEAAKGVASCFRSWLSQRGGDGAAEIQKGVEQVLRFLQTHGTSRFEDAWSDEKFHPHQRAGFRKDIDGIRHYYMFPEVFKVEACRGFNSKLIAKALREKKILEGDKDGKSSKSIQVQGHPCQRVYHFPGLPVGESEEEPVKQATTEPGTPAPKKPVPPVSMAPMVPAAGDTPMRDEDYF